MYPKSSRVVLISSKGFDLINTDISINGVTHRVIAADETELTCIPIEHYAEYQLMRLPKEDDTPKVTPTNIIRGFNNKKGYKARKEFWR